MITRGHFLGEIIDEFATISEKVKLRTGLGLTDLPVYAENFVRDVLNIVMNANFENLNVDRSNVPGLDLGDTALKIGVQVSATANMAKVNKTLKKITANQAKIYNRFIILIISKKQSSYTTPTTAEAKKYKFSTDDIWDLGDLARKAFELDLIELQRLHQLVRSEVAKLKIELEIPDENGEYPTTGYSMWEAPPQTKVGDGTKLTKFMYDQNEPPESELKRVPYAIEELCLALSRLPRVTREFLVMLYERRETCGSKRFKGAGWETVLLSKVKRFYNGPDLQGELDILQHAGFIEVNGEDAHEYGPPEVGVCITRDIEELSWSLPLYIESNELSIRKVIGSVDFSAF